MAAGCADRGRTEHENEERPVSLVALRFLRILFRPGRCPRACARVRARGKRWPFAGLASDQAHGPIPREGGGWCRAPRRNDSAGSSYRGREFA
jgi:hypothetical protein